MRKMKKLATVVLATSMALGGVVAADLVIKPQSAHAQWQSANYDSSPDRSLYAEGVTKLQEGLPLPVGAHDWFNSIGKIVLHSNGSPQANIPVRLVIKNYDGFNLVIGNTFYTNADGTIPATVNAPATHKGWAAIHLQANVDGGWKGLEATTVWFD